jgi:sialic acid synthase SpsE
MKSSKELLLPSSRLEKNIIGEITLGKTTIKKGTGDFYFIAEIGTNFVELAKAAKETPLVAAMRLINNAYGSGAQAVKFQIYEAEGLANIDEQPGQYKYLLDHEAASYAFYDDLIDFSRKLGIDFSASLFTEKAIEYFAPKLDYFKVASPDITNKPMLKKLGSYKKPILLSTAGSNIPEITDALWWIGHENVAILHCTAKYPTTIQDVNLSVIGNLNRYFSPNVIGFSDHLNPSDFSDGPLYAYIAGANILEKHFTLYRFYEGNDHLHSYIPAMLSSEIRKIKEAKILLGSNRKTALECERDFVIFGRRSLAAKRRIEIGETITEDDLTTLRPATGLPPYAIESVIGHKAAKTIDKNEILHYNHLE